MAEFTRAIQNMDTVVAISNTSQIAGGKTGDIVNIDTVINLTSPEQEELILVLPIITGNPDVAYLRTLNEVENRQEFQSPVDLEQLEAMPEEERVKIEELIETARKTFDKAKEASNKVALSTLKLDAGSQEIKFFQQKELKPISTDGGEVYELSFIAPQSNFSITAGRFTMSVIIILPKGASLYGEPEAVSPEGIPAPILEYSNKIGNIDRHVLQYSMQYDPIFTIRYKYN